MGSFGIKNHENLGADFLKKMGFSEKVVEIVRGHSNANRYLCEMCPEYAEKINDSAKRTLDL